MKDWPVTPLSPDVTVVADRATPALTGLQEERVAAIWAEALAKHPGLYNGRIFSADVIGPARISGHWTEYRRVLAQMREPGIFGAARPRPLAVVGMLRVTDGIVIGRRADSAVYLPGWWQGVPAGNVESREGEEKIDLRAQLMTEAQEEIGLEPGECTIGACLLACEHPDAHVVDVGIRLDVALSFAALRERCRDSGNGEYGALRLLQGMEQPEGPVVPTLAAMLERG